MARAAPDATVAHGQGRLTPHTSTRAPLRRAMKCNVFRPNTRYHCDGKVELWLAARRYEMIVRPVQAADAAEWLRMCMALWPDSDASKEASQIAHFLQKMGVI
jgi:hypothetical protein